MSEATVRTIAEADLPAVVALWHSVGLTRPWNDPERDMALARRNDHSTVLVATLPADDGAASPQIIATVMVGEDGHRGWLYYVAVSPDHRGRGLGRQVMTAAEDWLRARGVPKVQLLIRDDNPAAAGFYAKLGYEPARAICLGKRLDGESVAGRPR